MRRNSKLPRSLIRVLHHMLHNISIVACILHPKQHTFMYREISCGQRNCSHQYTHSRSSIVDKYSRWDTHGVCTNIARSSLNFVLLLALLREFESCSLQSHSTRLLSIACEWQSPVPMPSMRTIGCCQRPPDNMLQLSTYIGSASKCNAGRSHHGRYPGCSRLICHLARLEVSCKVCYRGMDEIVRQNE